MVVLIFVAFIALCLAGDAIIRYRKRSGKKVAIQSVSAGVFDDKGISIPRGVYFDKSHTWAFMNPEGVVKVGIDDFLQNITGKITRVELLESGSKITKGEKFLTIIQDGKRLSIKTPVSGKIRRKNMSLISNAGIINESPFTDGWIYEIEPDNWIRETNFFMMADKAGEWFKNEFVRFKDFLSASQVINQSGNMQIAMQDGGELNTNVLAEMGPNVWEDFQSSFLESA